MEGCESKTISSLECVLRSAHTFFTDLDKDKSGYLETKELMRFLEECDISVSEDECKKCINEVDMNGDGVWDFVEFMAFLGTIYSKFKKIKKKKGKKGRLDPKMKKL